MASASGRSSPHAVTLSAAGEASPSTALGIDSVEGLSAAESSGSAPSGRFAQDDTVVAEQPKLVPVREAFERFAADDAFGPEPSSDVVGAGLLSLAERRAALEHFVALSASGAKPGRDWKYDYANVASAIPLLDRPKTPLRNGRTRLIEDDQAAASGRSSYPIFSTRPGASFPAGGRFSLLRAPRSERAYAEKLMGTAVASGDDPFASLTRAFLIDALFIRVPAGTRLDEPVLLTHDAETLGVGFPYTVVVIEAGAEATILEDAQGHGFTCGIVEAIVAEGATLNYIAVQRTDENSTVLMNRGAVCAKDATARWYLAELGGGLSRSVVSTRLEGRGASSELHALFFNTGDQHVDLSSLMHHAVGDTTSRTTIKSAARDAGQGRYLGNIRIDANANGSDAALRDDALLLAKKAHIDSVPALEIASNDVKAFHGATVGSLDEEELFYAQTRGLARAEAERMIALGFFEPVLARFPMEHVRDVVRTALVAKAGPETGRAEAAA